MTFVIDAHEDFAYNALNFGRDYTLSAADIRKLETDEMHLEHTGGHTLLGWPDYQKGQVAVIFSTIFVSPFRYRGGDWDKMCYKDFNEAHALYSRQFDYYERLCEMHPDQFRPVRTVAELHAVMNPWQNSPADYPQNTHPVGMVQLLEGAEGVRTLEELEEWWERGLRIIGPVWAGTRYCGGMYEPGGFTSEGRVFLEGMADMGYVLDISHMNEESARTALDIYSGPVIASHANARALLKGATNERHLSDEVIRRLAQRAGVIGVLPFNFFLNLDWRRGDDRSLVTLETLVSHIDHICQLTGDARHVGIGTDFDGGFGWPAVPLEINTIADLQKLKPILSARGYNQDDIDSIFGVNWLCLLERTLPAS